jgi:hypothetical protein
MRDRWLPVGVLAGALFAINAIARFVVWLVASKSEAKQTLVGLIAVFAVAAAMIVAAYWWARRRPMPVAIGELSLALAIGCLLSVLVGPFAGGSAPFREGSAFFVAEIWHYLLIGAAGGVFGLLVVTALGRDYKSEALKRYARAALAKPRRVVRR